MPRKNTIIDTVHNLNWLTESVEFTKDIKRSQCKPSIDSFWSLGLMNHRDNNFHTRSTIEGFLALLPTDSIFLCFGQVLVQTQKNMSLISLNVDGFLDSLI